ncbi:MAG: AAA family ATPase [Planctomycetaceae bacterium]
MPIIPETTRKRAPGWLATALGPAGRAAYEQHKHDVTSYDERETIVRTPGTDMRALADVLGYLQHDTPERRALLQAIGLDAEAVAPRHCAVLSRELRAIFDREHASTVYSLTWDKSPWPSRDEDVPNIGLNTRRLCDVIAREVEWQRPGFTALGKLTLLSGPPGVGKTWSMMDHIARLTTGRPFPIVGNPANDCRDALFISTEDSDDDTLLPRIKALKGDASRVHTFQFVYGDGKRKSFALDRNIEDLDAWLGAHPLVELVVFDPISAILGKADSHRDAEVRSVLGPLAKVAEKRRVAIVGINHLTKGGEGQAMYRSMGSIAFVAAARIAWQVNRDPKEPGRSLLLPVKMNLGPTPDGLAFRITEDGVSWEKEPVTMTADEALYGISTKPRDAAKDWLSHLLADGPLPQKDIKERLNREKVCSFRTLENAKKELGVTAERVGGQMGGWFWSLPSQTT